MGTAEPLVSVIIPTYNREAYLREAVGSVFAQTYANWELIVADDGSTDGTRAYLESLHDPRVRVVECERAGSPGRMRNLGLQHSRGFYVAFLDDDDFWMPEKIARQVADLAARPNCRWNYTYFRQVDQRGEDVPLPAGRGPQPCAGWLLEPLLRGAAWVAPSSVLAERTLVMSVHGFDETLTASQDYDAFLKMSLLAEASVLTLPLSAHRVHSANTWRSMDPAEIAEGQIRVYSRLLAARIPDTARRACARELAAARTRLADCHRGQRRYGRSLGALVRALPGAAVTRSWWVALLKSLVRPLLPSSAVRLYHAFRHR